MSAALPICLPTRMRKIATASFPRKPMIDAATIAPRWDTGCGCTRRWIASYAATAALAVIVRTTASPARSSTRPNPNVKRRLGERRADRDAAPRGGGGAAPPAVGVQLGGGGGAVGRRPTPGLGRDGPQRAGE